MSTATDTTLTTVRIASTVNGAIEWDAVHDVQVPATIAHDADAIAEYLSEQMADDNAAWLRIPAFGIAQGCLDNNELTRVALVAADTPLTEPRATPGRLADAYLAQSPAENATTYAVRLLELSRLATALPRPYKPHRLTVIVSRRPRRRVAPLLITGQNTHSFRELGNSLADWRGPGGETFTALYTAISGHLTAALTDSATEPGSLGWDRPEPSFLRLWGLSENASRTWTVQLIDARALAAVAAFDQM